MQFSTVTYAHATGEEGERCPPENQVAPQTTFLITAFSAKCDITRSFAWTSVCTCPDSKRKYQTTEELMIVNCCGLSSSPTATGGCFRGYIVLDFAPRGRPSDSMLHSSKTERNSISQNCGGVVVCALIPQRLTSDRYRQSIPGSDRLVVVMAWVSQNLEQQGSQRQFWLQKFRTTMSFQRV